MEKYVATKDRKEVCCSNSSIWLDRHQPECMEAVWEEIRISGVHRELSGVAQGRRPKDGYGQRRNASTHTVAFAMCLLCSLWASCVSRLQEQGSHNFHMH